MKRHISIFTICLLVLGMPFAAQANEAEMTRFVLPLSEKTSELLQKIYEKDGGTLTKFVEIYQIPIEKGSAVSLDTVTNEVRGNMRRENAVKLLILLADIIKFSDHSKASANELFDQLQPEDLGFDCH